VPIALIWGSNEFVQASNCQTCLVMDDAIRQAIADLSALIKDADSEDAERIREIIERLRNFDADTRYTLECIARLHKKLYR
jgi:hypothetical protein